ncbi:MAG: hypothetical protein AABZ80_06110 [Gemmatimonadota bacterium]
MPKLTRFARGVSLLAVLGLASAAFTAPSMDASVSLVPTIGSVAAQLGVKVSGRADEEFMLGVQFTGSLQDPHKLASFGIKGYHVGARVVVACIALDRVHVEADEFDPPRREWVRVRMDANGKLTTAPKT